MRLIDADILAEEIKRQQSLVGEECHIFFDAKAILDLIDEQPTKGDTYAES